MIQMTSNTGLGVRISQFGALGSSQQPASTLRFGEAAAQQARTSQAGESLFMQGEDIRSVFILRDGWAFRYQCLEDGRRQILDFILPGDVVGIGPSSQMHYGVEALAPCAWLVIPRETLLAELSRQPALAVTLVNMLSAAQMRAFDQMTSIGRRTARERVAHLLLDLARRVRRSASNCEGVEITMPLMLSHIGDALGLATETVCRCLADLKRAGTLVFGAGRLEILDLERLSDLVGVTLDDESGAGGGSGKRLVA